MAIILDRFKYPPIKGYLRLHPGDLVREGYYLVGAGEQPNKNNAYTFDPNITLKHLKESLGEAYSNHWVYRKAVLERDQPPPEEGPFGDDPDPLDDYGFGVNKIRYKCRSKPLPLP